MVEGFRFFMKPLRFFVLFLALLSFVPHITGLACTIFMQCDNDSVLTGNNEDFFYTYDSMVWIIRGEDDEYSRVCFAISTYVQGGMNEKGLFYDGATCPSTQVPYDPKKQNLGMDAGEVVLSKCATVKEAIEFLESYNISASLGDHLMFADATGDAAVIEWIDNEMRVVPVENRMLAATNFFLTDPDLGGYPCDRYAMVTERLNKSGSLNLLEFSSILSSTTQEWDTGGTKYSNVYDLNALTVYVYEKADFSKVAVIHVEDEISNLAKGERSTYNINSIFYQEATALLGGEVTDYRKTVDHPTNTDEPSPDTEERDSEPSHPYTPVPEEYPQKPDSNSYLVWYILAGALVVFIVLFGIVKYRNTKNKLPPAD